MSIYESTEYLERNATWHVENSPWKAKQVFDLIHRNGIEASTVCDVGCGAGEVLVQLSSRLPSITRFVGYDISPHLEPMWRDRENDRIQFIRQDFLDYTGCYDIVMFLDVIEHIQDYIGFLRDVKGRGNYKIFKFPLEISAAQALVTRKFADSRAQFGHLHYFNKTICMGVLEELDYEIVDWFYAPGSIDLASICTSMSFSSKMLKYPRILMSKFSADLTSKLLGGYSLVLLTK